MSEYLKNPEGLFSMAEFHEVADMEYWNGLVGMAKWVLQQGPWPAAAPNVFSPIDNPMSSKQAQDIVAVDPFVQSLACAEKYSDEHTREYFRDQGYSNPGLRSWFGVYAPGKFSTTLSWDRPQHQHQTPSNSWKLDVLQHLVEHTAWLAQMKQWDIPHHKSHIKKAIAAWNDLSQNNIILKQYDPVQALGQGDSFSIFLTDCAMYYTGREPSVWLGGALMYPTLAAAEQAAKQAKINNYAVIRSAVAVMDVVATSTTADTSLIQSVVSSQQNARIVDALNNSSVKTSKTKSKM